MTNNTPPLTPDFLNELPIFETFLNRIGFKRIDGAVWGLLVLSERPLRSEEIESYLGLSQSAISISLKNLAHYGAVDFREDPDNKRVKLHFAKDDSLSIVSTVFRKREQQYVEEFKHMTRRLLKKSEEVDTSGNSARIKRLKSIIQTCEVAESVMTFVIKLTQSDYAQSYQTVLSKLPKTLDLLVKTSAPIGQLTEDTRNYFAGKLKEGLNKFGGV